MDLRVQGRKIKFFIFLTPMKAFDESPKKTMSVILHSVENYINYLIQKGLLSTSKICIKCEKMTMKIVKDTTSNNNYCRTVKM